MARKTKRKRKSTAKKRKSISHKTRSPNWLKSPTSRWVLGIIATVLVGFLFYYLTAKDSKQLHLQLDGLFMERHSEELKKKYPGGYMLFSIDSSKNKSKNEFIPSKSNFLEEYELNWNMMEISKLTETTVTLKLPWIIYKPQNSKILGWTQTIPRSPIGKSYPFKIDWQTNKNKLHIELIEDKVTVFAFAIGFRPE
jgi:hypothetical protein